MAARIRDPWHGAASPASIRKTVRRFAAHQGSGADPEPIHREEHAVPIVIQSRSIDDSEWSDEVWRRTHFEAFVVAKNKAKLTGRIYRLVDQDGAVLEEVRHLGSSFKRGRSGPPGP